MKVLTLIFFLSSIFCFSQKIEWTSEYNLNYKDFQGAIPSFESQESAGSMISIKYKILSNSVWTGKIKIYSTFDTSISWIKPEDVSSVLLNHEQKHFDFAQIFAFKLQQLVDEKIKSAKDFNMNFQSLYNKNNLEYEEFQTKYDLDTSHGTEFEVQEKYNNLITKMLESCNNS